MPNETGDVLRAAARGAFATALQATLLGGALLWIATAAFIFARSPHFAKGWGHGSKKEG
jgi:hypothetical protein